MKKIQLKLIAGLILVLFSTCFISPVLADRGRGRGDDDDWRKEKKSRSVRDYRPRYREDRERQERYRKDKNYFLDKRFSHNRYYPKRGHVVRELPRDYRVFKHRRDSYYFYDGIWYRPGNIGFTVVLPPIGLRIPVLPAFYTTIWVSGTPYYYADGVYYLWRDDERVYVVADPPPEEKAVPEPEIPDKLFIYPMKGQSKEQQATDRYECHSWSVGETGFDPTRPGGNVPEENHASKRAEYQRAMKACLEARNYSVQ